MSKIFITNNYEVWKIDLFRFVLIFLLILALQVFISVYIKLSDSVIGIIINSILSVSLSLILTFFITRKDLFSDKIMGEILQNLQGDKREKVEAYRSAIKSKLESSSIILSKKNRILLNELEVLFSIYDSCPPLIRNRFPSISNTFELFNKITQDESSLFQKFGFKPASLFYIFQINSIYYSTYYNRYEINTDLNLESILEIPNGLKIIITEINCKSLKTITDNYFVRYKEIRENFIITLRKLVEAEDNLKIVHAETDLILYNYCSELFELYIELEASKKFYYKGLMDVISLQILSNCKNLLRSVKGYVSRHLEPELSPSQISHLRKLDGEFSINEISPVLETYRLQLLGKKIEIDELYNFANQFNGKYDFLVQAIINNQWIFFLSKNEKLEYCRAYEKLNHYFHEKIGHGQDFETDFSKAIGNFELLYQFFNGTLDKKKVEKFHNLIQSSCKLEEERHKYEAIVFRFARIILDNELLKWYETKSLLSNEEKKAIEENLVGNLYYGNRINIENQLYHYCFPVAIKKTEIGKYLS